jgi:hypothetical protein
MGKVKVFEQNKLLGGYSLAVRDDWSFKVKRVHITEEEKEAYEKKFGNEILTYSEFFEWWRKFNLEHNSKFKDNE